MAGVDDLLPKLKDGVLLAPAAAAAAAAPNNPPDAGAEVPGVAPGVPKLKGVDMIEISKLE